MTISSLQKKIVQRQPGIMTFGITPPKLSTSNEKILEIARKQMERLSGLTIDGLVVYDIQDEAQRSNENRPFPFLPTLDSDLYAHNYLSDLNIPKIIYRCVGKYDKEKFKEWVVGRSGSDSFSVFVGAASRVQKTNLSLDDAYQACKVLGSPIIVGGVVIPERHQRKCDEHLRVVTKSSMGCSFFISQVVYNIEYAKNLLSDYYYHCKENSLEMSPLLVTLTPCGSQKTLEFMKWLGVHIPRWLENELLHSADILEKSLDIMKRQFVELFEFALDKKIPLGCNVESVSVRKVEIEASVQLATEIRSIIQTSLN